MSDIKSCDYDYSKVRLAVNWALDISALKDSNTFEMKYKAYIGHTLRIVTTYDDESCYLGRRLSENDALKVVESLRMLGYEVSVPSIIKE